MNFDIDCRVCNNWFKSSPAIPSSIKDSLSPIIQEVLLTDTDKKIKKHYHNIKNYHDASNYYNETWRVNKGSKINLHKK